MGRLNLKILNRKEIKKILLQLEEQFGFSSELDYVFLLSEKEKVYIVNKDVAQLDVDAIRVNSLGLYFGTVARDGFRLSMEGSQIVGPHATRNVLAVDEKGMRVWLRGEDLDPVAMTGYVILKFGDDFLGCGKATKDRIINHVPKTRRILAR